MLDDRQRIGRYFAQTGRMVLTPRQRRRIRHKEGHQSLGATIRREQHSIAWAKVREARKRTQYAPLPTP